MAGGAAPFQYAWSVAETPVVDGPNRVAGGSVRLIDGEVALQSPGFLNFTANGVGSALVNFANFRIEIPSSWVHNTFLSYADLKVTDAAGCEVTKSLPLLFTNATNGTVTPSYGGSIALGAVRGADGRMQIQWPARHYEMESTSIYRLTEHGNSRSWSGIGTLTNGERVFETDVSDGESAEFKVVGLRGAQVTEAYLSVVNRVPERQRRGRVVLVIEESLTVPLAQELEQFRAELAGDGWHSSIISVPRDLTSSPAACAGASPPPQCSRRYVETVKQQIEQLYVAYGDVEAVLLIGHVPVPMATISADGHGAREGPADGYYGDMMGGGWNWVGAQPDYFQRRSFPSKIELQVGRIDFSRLPVFGQVGEAEGDREIRLYRRYFRKNSDYRMGRAQVARRGLIHTAPSGTWTIGQDGHRIGAVRSLPTLYGVERMYDIGFPYFPFIYRHGFQFFTEYMTTPSASDFAAAPVQAVFSTYLRSWILHWNQNNAPLRASIAAEGVSLGTVYSGRPHVYFHHMASGGTIGESVRASQNNSFVGGGLIYDDTAGGYSYAHLNVHLSLLGDPTLRLEQGLPPENVGAVRQSQNVRITWEHSPDPEVIGYRVFRVHSFDQAPQLISGVVTTNSYDDPEPLSGSGWYVVRPLKEEFSPSGSYMNLGQGAVTRYP